jgi:drug/metabolite transporter (DMT)-like permease
MLLFWSFNFIIGKIALRHLDVFTVVSFRLVLAALILIPIYLAAPQRAKLDRRDLWTFAVLGFFGVLVNQGLFTIGLNYTSAGHSSLLVAMSPILVLLIARAKGLERMTFPKTAGMLLSFTGVAFLASEKTANSRSGYWLGDLLTLGAMLGFAIYAVFGKKVAAKYDTVAMNTFNALAAGILMLPLAIRQGLRLDWASVGWAGWASLFYMAAFSSVAAYLIFYWALRYMSAARLSTFSYIEPVLVPVLGILLLGERFTLRLLVGGAMVLLGVYIAERGPAEDGAAVEAVHH